MNQFQKLLALLARGGQKIGVGFRSAMGFAAVLMAHAGVALRVSIFHTYTVECFDSTGALKWREVVPNLVVDVGLDEILNQFYKGSAYTAAHYVGLKGTGTVAAADTMASHAGWSEIQTYSEGTREVFTPGSVASQSVDNSASKASFSINGSATVDGAFLTTNNTKGGTTGILIGAASFAASRSVENGDTLNVTVTATQAAA